MKLFDLIGIDIAPGSVWAMPTDTIYGLSCKALDNAGIETIDTIKSRSPDKSYIVLISDIEQIQLFGIQLDDRKTHFLEKVWPGPVSVILDQTQNSTVFAEKYPNGIAFRLPDDEELRNACRTHGPLITTSANRSGRPALLSSDDIAKEFKSEIDFVVTRDKKNSTEPSVLIKLLR